MAAACRLCRSISNARLAAPFRKDFYRWKHDDTLISADEISFDLAALDSVGISESKEGHRRHAGLRRQKAVVLPERLEKSVNILIEKYSNKDMVENAGKLSRYLWGRHVPKEDNDVLEMAQRVEEKVRSEDNIDVDALSYEERKKYEQKWKRKGLNVLRANIYHWQAVQYDARRGLMYMIGRMAQDYSVMVQCLLEIAKHEPQFKPRSIFDFGSGVGSVIWAVNKLWNNSVFEYYCCDVSADMNTIARLLLQDGDEKKDMHIKGVYFRQFFPSIKQNKYDLTVCAYTLFELPSFKARKEAIMSLWEMTVNYMILVENGTQAGFNLLLEARDMILQLQDPDGNPQGHVLAPCPHDMNCPMKSRPKIIPCNFLLTYKLFRGSKDASKESERYSYMILKKGPRLSNGLCELSQSNCGQSIPTIVLLTSQENNWPRLVQDVSKHSSLVHCKMCCPSGKIQHTFITARKNGKDLFKCAKYCKWGDLLPVTIFKKPAESVLRDDSPPELVAVSQGDLEKETCVNLKRTDDKPDTEECISTAPV